MLLLLHGCEGRVLGRERGFWLRWGLLVVEVGVLVGPYSYGDGGASSSVPHSLLYPQVNKLLQAWEKLQHKLDVSRALEELRGGVRPMARIGGCLCCGGTKVDAISHYEAEV